MTQSYPQMSILKSEGSKCLGHGVKTFRLNSVALSGNCMTVATEPREPLSSERKEQLTFGTTPAIHTSLAGY